MPEGGDPEPAERDWKEELLDLLVQAPPDRFERLAQRLLRETGFIDTSVTGRSGDGGIDGTGTYKLPRRQGPPPDHRHVHRRCAERGDAGRAPPIDLVDGDELCELLKRYELGVRTRQVEETELVAGFFDEI